MYAYVLQRIIYIIIMVAVMSVLVFGATHLLPGNVVTMILGQYSTPEAQAALELKFGLNDPLYLQYWNWASQFIQGNLGTSLITEQPVSLIVWPALQNSLVLASMAMFCVTIIGISLGVISAVNRGGVFDHAASFFGYVGISVPEFFWAIIFITIFSSLLGWLPSFGYANLSDGIGPFISHMILPVATLTLTLIAHVLRMTRSSMLEVLNCQYIKTARAKGLAEHKVIFRHALRNGLLPTITVLAFDLGWLIGGIVVIETVFGYPGIGRQLIFAVQQHDLPLLQAIILLLTVVYALSNLVADLLYSYFDPRIRYGKSAG